MRDGEVCMGVWWGWAGLGGGGWEGGVLVVVGVGGGVLVVVGGGGREGGRQPEGGCNEVGSGTSRGEHRRQLLDARGRPYMGPDGSDGWW